ncbi:hypothetical protein [Bradyrhizobium genosp. P]|uniref:hypothetical protein n=1 Tax=Bradyrhizobium genosp. P TaxID=83641 RepID=UPI003CF59089
MIGLSGKTGKIIADSAIALPAGFDAGLVKFNSNVDHSEIWKEAYAYSPCRRNVRRMFVVARAFDGVAR